MCPRHACCYPNTGAQWASVGSSTTVPDCQESPGLHMSDQQDAQAARKQTALVNCAAENSKAASAHCPAVLNTR